MDTIELPVGIRKNIYSSSLDTFFYRRSCICGKEAELLIKGRKKKNLPISKCCLKPGGQFGCVHYDR